MFLILLSLLNCKVKMLATSCNGCYRQLIVPVSPNCIQSHLFLRRFLANASLKVNDHYEALGLSREATAKEIKAAFFELSKKLHPDVNPSGKEEAAEKFQKVSEAYEVLGSEDKRRIYDQLTAPQRLTGQSFHRHPSGHHTMRETGHEEAHRKQKTWTDLDIDFKDFEHFQCLNRRKRQFTAWRDDSTTAETFWASQEQSKNYKDQRVLEREEEERRLWLEMEKRREKERIPVPTFEQLIRREELQQKKNDKKKARGVITVVPFFIFIFLCFFPQFRR